MNYRKAFPLAPMVVALGLGMGGMSKAHAEAYAYSINDINNLTTVFTCTSSGTFCGGALSLSSYQSSSTSDANVIGVNGNSGVSGADTAAANTPITLAGNGAITSGFNADSPDAPLSFQQSGGVAVPAENDFTAIGQTGFGTNYAAADAVILSESIRDANPGIPGDANDVTQAIAESEGYLSTLEGAVANATNTSTTGFTMRFSVDESWSLALAFDASPFLQTFIGNGGSATGDLDVSFTITQDLGGGLSNTIFNWAPDGIFGSGIAGGTESADDADLNLEVADTTVDGNPVIYDPLTNDTDCSSDGFCNYAATTSQFGAGTFTLVLSMHNGVVLTQTAVPEPGTLALMGLGLAGIGGIASRSRKKA